MDIQEYARLRAIILDHITENSLDENENTHVPHCIMGEKIYNYSGVAPNTHIKV
jgi:hypothetical protein